VALTVRLSRYVHAFTLSIILLVCYRWRYRQRPSTRAYFLPCCRGLHFYMTSLVAQKMPLYHRANIIHLRRVTKMMQKPSPCLASGSEPQVCGNDVQNKLIWGLTFSVMSWSLVTDVSGQLIGTSFKGQLPVTSHKTAPRDISQQRRNQTHSGWNLKSMDLPSLHLNDMEWCHIKYSWKIQMN